VRGLGWGTLAMVALYVFLQPGSSARIAGGSSTLVGFLRRLSDPTVAPIHQAPTPGTTWHDGTPATPPGGGGSPHMPHESGPALPPTTIQV
jgi:hypothetical protein